LSEKSDGEGYNERVSSHELPKKFNEFSLEDDRSKFEEWLKFIQNEMSNVLDRAISIIKQWH
jgi:hypothetical protein